MSKQEIINFTVNAGLKLYGDLWDKYDLSQTFGNVVPKQSGASIGKIMQNLFFRNLIDANSMVALAEKDKEEYFLAKNVKLHRTSYGRNLNKLDDEQRRKVLLKFNDKLVPRKKVDKKALMIYDRSAVEVFGDNYENADWVWDSCQEKMVWGYGLDKFMLKTKKRVTVFGFDVNNKTQDNVIEFFKRGRMSYGWSRVAIDADPELTSMDFYKRLDEEEFLFYTKAVKSWKFNYGLDFNIEELRKKVLPLLKRNKVVSRIVYKDDMQLRLVFHLKDKRVILTNDFKSKPTEVYKYYVERWGIETSFREEKQNLGLNILPTRKLAGIKTHFLLCMLAYVLSQFIINKVKIADGIKLVKRKLVKVWAVITQKYNKLVLEFDIRYKYIKVFNKLLEMLNS